MVFFHIPARAIYFPERVPMLLILFDGSQTYGRAKHEAILRGVGYRLPKLLAREANRARSFAGV